MSFHYWRNRGRPKKTQFVSLEGSYHGETLGALSVTDVALFRETYEPLLRSSSAGAYARLASRPVRRKRGATSRIDAPTRSSAISQHITKASPRSSSSLSSRVRAGMVMYDAVYLRRAREICTRFDVHLIADEIMTGFGRTGTFFAHEQAGITPDFLCLSKGITGGYLPLSVVHDHAPMCTMRSTTMQLTRGFLHSHSYTGNPLACRAALAVAGHLRYGSRDRVESHESGGNECAAYSARASPACGGLSQHRHGVGLRSSGGEDTNMGRRIYEAALAREMLLRPIGNTVYFMPPYTLTDEEQQLLADRTLEIIESL